MANNPAHRASRRAAARFGLESMESRTLLSGGAWNHHDTSPFSASNRIEQSRHHDGEIHVSARRHDRGGDTDEGFSFQARDRDRNNGYAGARRDGPRNSPAAPPDFAYLPPWVRNPEPEAEPTPPIAPSSNGNGNTIVETAPVLTEAPRSKTQSRAATDEAVVTTVSGAPAPSTTSRLIANATAVIASSPQNTTAAVLDWVKSGAIYAADVARLTPAAIVEDIAPAATTVVERLANTEKAVLSAAVDVIATPAREFHIARLGSPLALMQDAIGSFIEQSVWPSSEQTAASPRRAWYVTLAVLTFDATLLTYYFQRRARKQKPLFMTLRGRPRMVAIDRRHD